MATKRSKKHIPRESQTFASRDEVGTFDEGSRRGASLVSRNAQKAEQRILILKDENKVQQLRDFIFGLSTENPLEEIKQIDEKAVKLQEREYKNPGIVSIPQDKKDEDAE